MDPMTRREFRGRTAAGTAAAGFMLASAGTPSANTVCMPLGSQTYPHRAMIADGKFVQLLKQLKSIGVDQIELCGYLGGAGYPEFQSLADGKATRKIIEDNGLKAVSCHFLFPELRENLVQEVVSVFLQSAWFRMRTHGGSDEHDPLLTCIEALAKREVGQHQIIVNFQLGVLMPVKP